jgi:proteasome lid subunit RPN8/RPN11
MNEPKFGSWSVDASPVSIEYSLVVIEEIRREVSEGFQRLSRGGIEVGGILYGTQDGRTVRILAIRPIACEHARGPAFLLSDQDRRALVEQLARDRSDSQLEGFVAAGWFLSHTRSGIYLTDSDLEIYNEYFSAPWQVTMVVRPGRGGSMRAGFFVREADGNVETSRSYLEFNFPDRLSAVLDRSPRPERPGSRLYVERSGIDRRSQLPELAPLALPSREEKLPPGTSQAPQLLPAPSPRKKWPWLVAWAAIVVTLAVLSLRFLLEPAGPQPLSLTLVERDGQLQIEWNPRSKPVAAATRGSLAIADGKEIQNLNLTAAELSSGHHEYRRKGGDVEVRLIVQTAGGQSVQEASRYLGQPPSNADPGQLKALQDRRAELEAEVRRLQKENQLQTERIQQLERTLRILETRLGGAK